MRNDVPGGAEAFLVPPPSVAKAGGARGRILIEHLRAKVRALEQVPVSLAIPPAPGAAPPPPRPACSFFSLSSFEGGFRPPPQDDGIQVLKRHPEVQGAKRRASKDDTQLFDHLKRGGLHEIRPQAYRDAPAALGFALAMIAETVGERVQHRDLVLWCFSKNTAREWGRPYGPGLLSSGLDPARFLIVEALNAEMAAWALEEGLKSGALIAALSAIEIETPLAARRLSLAAQASRTPCLLLASHRQANLPGTLTAWRVAAQESTPASFDKGAPGAPAWQLTLERCRGEAPGQSFIVEFSHGSFRLCLSPPSSDRAIAAGESSQRRRASRR